MTSLSEDKLVAVQAAEWVQRLKSPSDRERAEFMRWLMRSPLHVKEILLAITVDAELRGVDADHKIDVDALVSQAATDMPAIGEREGVDLDATPWVSSHWRLLAVVGAVAVVSFVLGLLIGRACYSAHT